MSMSFPSANDSIVATARIGDFESIWFGDEPCHFVGGLAVYHLAKRTFRLREFLIVSCIDENIRYKIS